MSAGFSEVDLSKACCETVDSAMLRLITDGDEYGALNLNQVFKMR